MTNEELIKKLKEMVNTIPNDMDLGLELRKLIESL